MNHFQTVTYRFYTTPNRQYGDLTGLIIAITIDGQRKRYSTPFKVAAKIWDQKSQRASGRSTQAKRLNNSIQNYLTSLNAFAHSVQLDRKHVNHQDFKFFLNKQDEEDKVEEHTIKVAIDRYCQLTKEKIDISIVHKTYQRNVALGNKISSFIKHRYKKDDIRLKDLKISFLTDFEHYLLTIDKIGINHIAKYVSILKTVIKFSVEQGWIARSPFIGHKSKRKSVSREILTMEEIRLLEEKKIHVKRIDAIRDIFLFCCYTGYAYADVKKLKYNHIQTRIDGMKWIITERVKTKVDANVPLLPPALRIIEKYRSHPKCQLTGCILPVNSNQRMNVYLKELADICGIQKNLTTHIARHTFATTISLSNGVSLESVSKMLGHTNLKTTQIYAKVLEGKVSTEFKALKEKLFSTNDDSETKDAKLG